MTKATTLSDNTVYAQLDADVGPDEVRSTAYAMGITSHLDGLPAEGIGGLRIGVSPLEMADAYATLANGGVHIAPTAITKVVFPDGPSSTSAIRPHKRVFPYGQAYAATQVLKTVVTERDRHRRQLRLPGRGQDRDHEQLHRRVVRRLHATARDLGVGGISELDRVDGGRKRARPRLWRHAGRADLARLHGAGQQRLLRRLHAPDGSRGRGFRSRATSRPTGQASTQTTPGARAAPAARRRAAPRPTTPTRRVAVDTGTAPNQQTPTGTGAGGGASSGGGGIKKH